MKITQVVARQILDSRGTPTVEADVWLESGIFGRAAVPSGASTGAHEAHELRDAEKAFGGKGVLHAIANIESEINKLVCGMVADDQFLLDQKMIELDGTENKSRLGANAILAVSLACAHAAAKQRKLPLYQQINDIAGNPQMSLPMPMMNVLNGGVHASNSSDFQEFMIVPLAASNYQQAVRIGAEVFASLKQIISSSGQTTTVGDEGGFTYPVTQNSQMLDLLIEAVTAAGYQPGNEVAFALDVAASEFSRDGSYRLASEQLSLGSKEMIDNLEQLAKQYPIVSIEDGLDQDAWTEWQTLTRQLGKHLQLVGDDLFVTNPARLQQGIELEAANSILIKPNQIGSLTETIKTIQLAKDNNYSTIISHRSGETEDTTIAHLAVGTGAGQIKTGSLSRSERTAKHNELMRIEQNSELRLSNPF